MHASPKPRPNAGTSTPRVSHAELEALLLAGFGATCAVLTWLVVGALTGMGKVPSLIFPTTIIAALIGAIIGLTRAAIALWIASGVAILAFCVIAMTPFVTTVLPTKSLVRRDSLPQGPLGAVVVLSAGITPDSLLTPEALDRLLSALQLMRDSVAPLLVVSVPQRTDNGITAASDQARVRALVARPFQMLSIDSVHNTHDEAVNSWRLLQPRGVTRIAVVTSPLHTRRACATFEHAGFTVTCIPAVSRMYSVENADNGFDRLVVFREFLYERAALVEYRGRGWMRD